MLKNNLNKQENQENKMKTQNKKLKIALGLIFLVSLISFILPLANAMTISDFSSSPSELIPGGKASFDIDIENNLGDDFDNVVVMLDLTQTPFAPYQSGSTQIIESINDGDIETATFELVALADAKSGIYKIPVIISYQLENKTISVPGFISLTINSKPEFQLGSDNSIIKGQNNKISIRITNIGLTGSKFLNVKIGSISNAKILGNSEVYIGNIDSDDFDSVDLDIFVNENAGSIVNIPVSLSYRDSTNKEYSETINLALKSYTNKEAVSLGIIKQNFSLYYVIVFVVLIVLYLIYRKIKKRNKKKRQAQEA